jgi:glycosyltransferase involved in cell wall biosynthesis
MLMPRELPRAADVSWHSKFGSDLPELAKDRTGEGSVIQGNPPVRVVIPCRDADEFLGACLAAINGSKGLEFEVVVVDDGGNSCEALAGDAAGWNVVRSAGGSGAGSARNLGAKGFAGTTLVFIDADVELAHPDALAQLVESITRQRAEATVGCYHPGGGRTLSESYKNRYLAYMYGPAKRGLRNSFWTALCAVNREWYEAAGGFNESYAGAGPEDIEFGMALTRRGGRIRSVPEAVGYHHARMNLRGLVWNDLRKGSEDIYVHLRRKVSLTDNRHVRGRDVCSVVVACLLLLLFPLWSLSGGMTAALGVVSYLALRRPLLLGAFRGEGPVFLILATLLTFILDVVRACAVIGGTLLRGIELLSGGRFRPFQKPRIA